MSKEIWCTLGPASLNDRVIGRLEELGVSLFRLNLSHTKLEKVAEIVEFIQTRTKVPVCLDSEGAQVRTSDLAGGKIVVRENNTIRIHFKHVPGDATDMNLNPDNIAKQLEVGDLLKIDAEVLAQVTAIESEWVVLWVLNGGEIGQNKAVTVLERDLIMPAMTDKDRKALAIGNKMGVRHVALSFANRAADVDEVRALVGRDTMITSKIECLNGLHNLPEITAKSDALLIDRGDLSRQVNIEKIPALQKDIIRHAKVAGKRIYVATNLLESMVTSPNPTRAEVNDVFNTLMDGADGLVLAAETAIGAFPVSAAMMVRKVMREYENKQSWKQFHYTSAPISTLVEPHGGLLINRESRAAANGAIQNLRTLQVENTELMDCVQIANGAYSPLTGFMGSKELAGVLNHNRLLNGQIWTMPIVLQSDEKALTNISAGDVIALTDANAKIHATMNVREIYTFDFNEIAQKWFGTTSRKHPGVAKLSENGSMFVAGEVTLVDKLASPYEQYELSPRQTRMIFAQKSWSRVVGFQTGQIPNRLQEYAQLRALEAAHADGLYINSIIGPQQSGDFLPESIFKSYQLLLNNGVYPPGKILLGAAFTHPRHGGPRETVFNALCFKNMGCSHFIVEHDNSRDNGFYENGQTREFFKSLGDLGITPIFFDAIEYNPDTQKYFESKSAKTTAMSDQAIQAALLNKEALPEWIMRDAVQEMLRKEIGESRPVFYD
jgi:pyruvate kinase